MPNRATKGVRLVEATRDQFVIDMDLGRVIIEPDSICFDRVGRRRGKVLLEKATIG